MDIWLPSGYLLHNGQHFGGKGLNYRKPKFNKYNSDAALQINSMPEFQNEATGLLGQKPFNLNAFQILSNLQFVTVQTGK